MGTRTPLELEIVPHQPTQQAHGTCLTNPGSVFFEVSEARQAYANEHKLHKLRHTHICLSPEPRMTGMLISALFSNIIEFVTHTYSTTYLYKQI